MFKTVLAITVIFGSAIASADSTQFHITCTPENDGSPVYEVIRTLQPTSNDVASYTIRSTNEDVSVWKTIMMSPDSSGLESGYTRNDFEFSFPPKVVKYNDENARFQPSETPARPAIIISSKPGEASKIQMEIHGAYIAHAGDVGGPVNLIRVNNDSDYICVLEAND